MIDSNNPGKQTVPIIKNYINLKIDIALLQVSQKMSSAAAYFVFAIIMGFIALFISLFLSLSLASWIATTLNIPGMGNLIVGLIYVIIGTILYVFRNKLILQPVQKSMAKAMDFSDLNGSITKENTESIEDTLSNLQKELTLSEESLDYNLQDIKDYYSFEQMKDRFFNSILSNPKSLLNILLVVREVLVKKRRKKEKNK